LDSLRFAGVKLDQHRDRVFVQGKIIGVPMTIREPPGEPFDEIRLIGSEFLFFPAATATQ
jgi:hypothetical protein